ncbi:MAG: vWA domain-containing protein [Thermoguttaceae bacterium]
MKHRFVLLSVFLFAVLLGCSINSSLAQQCVMEVAPSQSVLKADKINTLHLKVGITGFEMKGDKPRTPLNIALVLDRSGSMAGAKIEQLKKAAILAVDMMDADDILSVVAYSSEVEVLVPATKLTNKEIVRSKIKTLTPTNSTALYAGTKTGAAEVEKFLAKERVNRVILLSDGLANVGPRNTSELKALGLEIGSKGISVTTFGLGDDFNEDLMSQLASASDGNHVFITKASNTQEVFADEFQVASKVVAQDVSGKITVSKGCKILRALNMPVEIEGQTAFFNWKQIYSRLQRYIIFEIEVPAGENMESRDIATVQLSYMNMATHVKDDISAVAKISYSNSNAKVEASINRDVHEVCSLQLANLANEEATRLRDTGDKEGAKRVLLENASRLREEGRALGGSALLDSAATMNAEQADNISDDADWSGNRKIMRANQRGTGYQQAIKASR